MPAIVCQASQSCNLFVDRQKHQHYQTSKEEKYEDLFPRLKHVGAQHNFVTKLQELQLPAGGEICSEAELDCRYLE